ncbi:MAG TPA: TonB-dependent receptor [Rhizomicrobium sp.]|nr:TonB-dependent receptor [Rhizomicrobium sp.]
MTKRNYLKSALVGSASALTLTTGAFAADFHIPGGDLEAALNAYTAQAGVQLIVSDTAVRGAHTRGAQGELTAAVALSRILEGTGFATRITPAGVIAVVHAQRAAEAPAMRLPDAMPVRLAAAAAATGIESVVVTSSKIKGDIQTVPIAITALSQEQLTSRQIAGGPDLVKEVPNLTFSKTNFTGYNIQIRGIGTQAISVTTDPAVAVAFNDTPFIRNHFFEQEFYDLSQAEVLRGPQGTLYGRNATAGVVNLISAKPTDQFEAMASADIGNYHNRRFEGMINVPIVDDRLDLRVAGEWTKRDGYSFNQITNAPIDGRDLWSSRVTLGWKPSADIQAYLVWEHFSESDDRLRSGKQLCKYAPTPTVVGGVLVATNNFHVENPNLEPSNYLSQGCELTSLYSPDAFQTPNAFALPYASDLAVLDYFIRPSYNPYVSTTQSRNLRVIESALNPTYRAKNDTLEFNADYDVTPALTVTSQTGYNNDFLWSAEDYNRFNTAPGFFFMGVFGDNGWDLNSVSQDPSGAYHCAALDGGGDCNGRPAGAPCDPAGGGQCIADAIFCDPQLGCSSRLVAEDLSEERSWQLSQEFRLSSKFSGPLNFSVGGNFLHYETEENYYVFINSLTSAAADNAGGSPFPYQQSQWVPGVSDNSQCIIGGFVNSDPAAPHNPLGGGCSYIDPNPITRLNNKGHNYFLSQNPYVLNSYAGFGEAYYDILPELKLIGGLRWTDDEKHFTDIPSELLVPGYGYASTGVVNQKWNQWTGRAAANWTPKLDFTDQTLVYGSYSHGYKAGGANPPGAVLLTYGPQDVSNPIHPLIFKPEFVDAFELGSKNTLLDGALTLNGDVFYYNYKGYQISRIVDRTAINDNFDAHIKGAELESTWEPLPGLKLNFAGGYEDARAAKGDHSVDLMDRTAGNPNWMVIKNFPTQASNCIVPVYVIAAILNQSGTTHGIAYSCGNMYSLHEDPLTELQYVQNPTVQGAGTVIPPGYPGYDPLSVDPNAPANVNNGLGLPPNNGQGFDKDLSGNQLPNAPHFTTSFSAEYTMPVSEDWAATLHSDFYWQSQSYARIFNDRPYDKLRGYSTTNLALILTSASGWQVMGYLKNVFNATAITGDFLNSDDSGLTTNVFMTDPRLFGVRVTKNW